MIELQIGEETVTILDARIREVLPPPEIIHKAKEQFRKRMNLNGTHGTKHWSRVLENGLLLAHLTGADMRLVAMFATIHDCQRWDEYRDEYHGRRAADFTCSLGDVLGLTAAEMHTLQRAIRYHSAPYLQDDDIHVQTCWDADRLDLWRIGIQPDPKRLCTVAARHSEVIRWAHDHLKTEENWYR